MNSDALYAATKEELFNVCAHSRKPKRDAYL